MIIHFLDCKIGRTQQKRCVCGGGGGGGGENKNS